ncbi:MAG: hypothetical protein RLZZ46_899, partial [Bacteroidota bacterium]
MALLTTPDLLSSILSIDGEMRGIILST